MGATLALQFSGGSMVLEDGTGHTFNTAVRDISYSERLYSLQSLGRQSSRSYKVHEQDAAPL